jgi:hypothetical protein
MLGKMLIHGLVAAAILGSAAAVYAQVKDNGYLAPAATADQRKEEVADMVNGYLRPTDATVRGREDERRQGARSEHHRERHDRKRGHDDDDD